MATIDQLPADQKAVLQLVLTRGRGYDKIAAMLGIDRAAVRDRALAGLDALGPQTRVPAERRQLIADYLLGQLPPKVAASVHQRLGQSASERAWARVIAAELATVAVQPLPEIPVATVRQADTGGVTDAPVSHSPEAAAGQPDLLADGDVPNPVAEPADGSAGATPARASSRRRPAEDLAPGASGRRAGAAARRAGAGAGAASASSADGPAPSSRLGGIVLLGLVGLVIVVGIVIALTSGGNSSHPSSSQSTSSAAPVGTPSTTTASATTGATGATGTAAKPKVTASIALKAGPAGGKAAGVAEVLRQGSNAGIAIVAEPVPPNTTKPANAYAVWLYNSPSDAKLLGFVNPGVSGNGKLRTAGGLPANASHYRQVIITVETKNNPTRPGTIVLEGPLSGLS